MFLNFISSERLRAEKADNARERALEKMMAGRLEANLEEELKKELVKPEFMSKPDSEWTEEEQKAAKEFEKKQQKVCFVLRLGTACLLRITHCPLMEPCLSLAWGQPF